MGLPAFRLDEPVPEPGKMKTITIFGLAALLLSGCASSPNIDRMATLTPPQGVAPSALRGNIAVSAVVLGQSLDPGWATGVGPDRFELALESSLRKARLLSAARDAGSYMLVARLENVEPANPANGMTVTLTVSYLMLERAGGKQVLARTVTIPYHGSMAPASAAETLRMANEGAVRANIAKIIDELFAIGPGKVV
jgi:hypothetical protein